MTATVTQAEQRMAALEKAQSLKMLRIELGRSFGDDPRQAIVVLEQPSADWMLGWRLSHMLRRLPQVGPRAITRLLLAADVKRPDARIGDLTPRQRQVIADRLRVFADGRDWPQLTTESAAS